MFHLRVLFALPVALACGSGPGPDSGVGDGGRDSGATATLCARLADCEDGLYCTAHRCEPGAADADERGCVLDGDPCDEGSRCIEAEDRCAPLDCAGLSDADGDGHASLACGGDDCDDFDSNRYPGNAEVCDAEAHDEDCDADTFGDTDADSDGFVDAACCNGAQCAADCDDENRDVAPGAMETCDGIDSDCDGIVDDSESSLCPGGECVAGRCDLRGWDRTFGGATNEDIVGAAIDGAGNVYILGEFADTLRFGAASVEPGGRDVFVASYGPTGSFRWVLAIGGESLEDFAGGIAHHSASDQIVVHISTRSMGEVVAGVGPARTTTTSSSFLIAIEPSGSVAWGREVFATADGAVLSSSVAAGERIEVLGRLAPGTYFADGAGAERDIEETTVFVATYEPTGEPAALLEIRSSNFPQGLAVDSTGNRYLVDGLGGLASYGPAGTLRWRGVPNTAPADVASFGDRVFVVGSFTDPQDLGGGMPEGEAGPNTFIAALGRDGGFLGATTWSEPALNMRAVEVISTGAPVVTGDFRGVVDLGGGSRESTPGGSLVYLELEPSLIHRADEVFSAPACVTADGFCPSAPYDIAVGPADSTAIVGSFAGSIDLGSGPRVSVGSLDGFVVRLAN